MKVKTSELTGAALDWVVAKCENHIIRARSYNKRFQEWLSIDLTGVCDDDYTIWSLSEDWSQGGPTIEREGIAVSPSAAGINSWVADMPLKSTSFADKTRCSGPTPLIAAMRCYVVSKLGDEIEIPQELLPSD